MTNESHRCIPAASWVEACELIFEARKICDWKLSKQASAPVMTLAQHLHRIEQILLTSDSVATPHLGDDFGPETTCKRAMEGIR